MFDNLLVACENCSRELNQGESQVCPHCEHDHGTPLDDLPNPVFFFVARKRKPKAEKAAK